MGFWQNFWNKPKNAELEREPDEDQEFPDAVVVTDVLDLHGFFPEQVPEMIEEFILNAQELELKSLRIIHGKGKSKLKWIVLKELEKYSQVDSFRDAPAELGGWGATLVYLKEVTDGPKQIL